MFRTCLFAVLLLFAIPAAASPEPEVFTAHTRGTLTIDTAGRVVAVAIEPRRLGAEAVAALESQVRTWRFEPIVEDGKPVNASGHMSLDLLALRTRGEDGVRLGILDVRFDDPPGTVPAAGMPSFAGKISPPRYPDAGLRGGIGAKVTLMLRVSGNGMPEAVGAERVWLMGARVRSEKDQHRFAQLFARAAETAAAKWTFNAEPGQVVRVPINFTPPGFVGDRWAPSQPQRWERAPWIVAELALGEAIPSHDPGSASSRLRLLTVLDPDAPLAAPVHGDG